MSCHHSPAGHVLECTIRSNRHQADYGFIAPFAPTFIASSAELALPVLTGELSLPDAQASCSGFLSAPSEPPRA
jgi:hypothetical protein